ncbi:hypothetical protein [Acetobacter aceti]|uniref:Uncharacterized protein n=1 Tax=Acetobacter aceti TaxID=435 RepID=A0A6S6PF23_ACEAC|nr:hypothetical protein [Acetobacter aceti]BCI65490.1 hypothetical protein AAJCM20276_01140 [Acetobacter aceti]
MTDESVKARIERGDWVTLDEAFPELVPSDLLDSIAITSIDAERMGGIPNITKAIEAGSDLERLGWEFIVPGHPAYYEGWEPLLGAQTAQAARELFVGFREEWGQIDAVVRRALASNEWQTQKIEGLSATPVESCVWDSLRLCWEGETTFTDTFPDVMTVVPNAKGGGTHHVPLRLFQIRQVSTVPDASVPKTVALTNRTTRSPSESGCLAAELAREFWLDEGEEYRSGDGKQAKCMNFVQGGLVAAGYEQMSKSGLSPIIKRESKRIRDEKAQFRDGSEKV